MAQPFGNSSLQRSQNKLSIMRLRSALFDSETSLTLLPLQLLFISLGFIVSVLFMHVLLKIFPDTTPLQILISIIVLLISLGISMMIKKKQ